MKNNNEFRLIKEIIDLSEASIWDQAVLEWALKEISFSDEPDTCLCGHYPIIEICTLRNKKNANIASVGNCCVKKFMGLPSDKIFQAIKRVQKENEKSLNTETIEHAYQKQWITRWDYDFYFNIWRKKNLSEKQISHKIRINNVVLSKIMKK